MPSWSTEEVTTSIREVEFRRCIWNVYSDDYKDKIDHLCQWFQDGCKLEQSVSLKNCVTPRLLEQPIKLYRDLN